MVSITVSTVDDHLPHFRYMVVKHKSSISIMHATEVQSLYSVLITYIHLVDFMFHHTLVGFPTPGLYELKLSVDFHSIHA